MNQSLFSQKALQYLPLNYRHMQKMECDTDREDTVMDGVKVVPNKRYKSVDYAINLFYKPVSKFFYTEDYDA